jgi:hypothetical protein
MLRLNELIVFLENRSVFLSNAVPRETAQTRSAPAGLPRAASRGCRIPTCGVETGRNTAEVALAL